MGVERVSMPAKRRDTPASGGPRTDTFGRRTAPWVDRSALAAAELVVVEGGPVGRRFPIFGGEVIGRGEEASVQIDVDEVSREHCRVVAVGESLFRVGAALQIEDLGSRNGTWVRGERIVQPCSLAFGERITLGSVVLLVARQEVADHDEEPLERYASICDLVTDAAAALDAALGVTLGAIDELRGAPTTATMADSVLRGAVGNLIGSVHHQLELARRLHELGRAEPFRDARVDLAERCHAVVRHLLRDRGDRVQIESRGAIVEVKGDLVELHQLILGAAEHLLAVAPDGGRLELVARIEPGADGRPLRQAIVELRREGASAVVPEERLQLARELQRRATLHGGRIDPAGGELGYRITLPAMPRSRGGATRAASTSLADRRSRR